MFLILAKTIENRNEVQWFELDLTVSVGFSSELAEDLRSYVLAEALRAQGLLKADTLENTLRALRPGESNGCFISRQGARSTKDGCEFS